MYVDQRLVCVCGGGCVGVGGVCVCGDGGVGCGGEGVCGCTVNF